MGEEELSLEFDSAPVEHSLQEGFGELLNPNSPGNVEIRLKDAQQALEDFEAQEEAREQDHRRQLREGELTAQTIRMIATDLINQLFTGLSQDPKFGDLDKVMLIADHVVRNHGARNSEEAIRVVRSMAMASSRNRSMVDGVLDMVLGEKLAMGGEI